MTGAAASSGTYQIITRPNALKARVGAGPGIDNRLTAQAHAAVDFMRTEFRLRVIAAVDEISGHLEAIAHALVTGEANAHSVYRLARDLQSQGAAFDYPLVSDICASLCGYLQSNGYSQGVTAPIVRAHTDALLMIMDNSIAGDGGYEGLALIESLNKLVTRSRA